MNFFCARLFATRGNHSCRKTLTFHWGNVFRGLSVKDLPAALILYETLSMTFM